MLRAFSSFRLGLAIRQFLFRRGELEIIATTTQRKKKNRGKKQKLNQQPTLADHPPAMLERIDRLGGGHCQARLSETS
jgi:hypothetical protein